MFRFPGGVFFLGGARVSGDPLTGFITDRRIRHFFGSNRIQRQCFMVALYLHEENFWAWSALMLLVAEEDG